MAEYIWCLRLLTVYKAAHGLCSLAGRDANWRGMSEGKQIARAVVRTGFQSQGSYGQGKSGNFEWVRESRGKQRVREKSGNFKIPLTRPIIYALFSQFSPASGGFAPRPLPGLRPKHCRLVYIAIFLQWNKIYYYICVLSIALLVSRIKKLVRENYSFCLEKSGKMNSAK